MAKYKVGEIVNGKLEVLSFEAKFRKNDTTRKETFYTVKCRDCGYVRETVLYAKTGCPCCTNKITVKGINDINTTHPHIGKMLKNYEEGYNYTIGTCTNLAFVCPHCKSVIVKNPYKLLNGEASYQYCRDTISFGEKLIREILKERNIDYAHDVRTEWSGTKRYDFYISSLNMIIETHGSQHYRVEGSWNKTEESYLQQVENDKYKEELALRNSIEHYVVLDTSIGDIDYVLSQIITNPFLNSILKVEELNKEELYIKIAKPLMLEAVEIWERMEREGENPTSSMIAKEIGKSRAWVKDTLKKASELGLCSYTLDIAEERRKEVCRKKNSRKIIATNRVTGEVIEFSSIKGASKKLGYCHGSIANALTGRSSYSGDYYWKYAE